jgi:ankyrin repeat protein
MQSHNSLLYYAALKGNVGILSLLLERGADIDKRNHENATALMCAALHGHGECVRALLAAGASVSQRDR